MFKVFYSPFPSTNTENRYLNQNIKALQSIDGIDIVPLPSGKMNKIKFLCDGFLFKRDCIILNWLENLFRKNSRFSIYGACKFFLLLFFYRLVFKKVIYVRHNMYPHELNGLGAKAAKLLTSVAEKICSAKISHSEHMIEKGYTYIPHPLYEINDKFVGKHNISPQDNKNNYYVIFGRISRYKKIEHVVDKWDVEIPLLVAGSCNDVKYLEYLKKKSEGKNVIFESRFIEENEAQRLVANSKGMILAHADPDMIVSGSFFYSVTLGTPVHAVEKPFLRWLNKEKSFAGLYIYETPGELVRKLCHLQNSSSFNGETDRNNIRLQAELLFGDAAVRNAWHDLFIRISS